MQTSYSALDTFRTCPKKYEFQEIEKRKAPKRPEAVFGTIVHATLKYMYSRTPLYPTLDEAIDYYAKNWNEAVEKISWPRADLKERTAKLYFEEGVGIIKNFYKKNAPWMQNAVELESRFSAKVVDPATGTEHALRGFIDRIDKDPGSDAYEIIDYKTGKKMPGQESLEENLQLGLYALAIRERWPQVKPESITTTLYFLKHNEKISAKMTEEKIEQAKKRVLAIITEIEKRLTEKKPFEPIPGPLCDYCGFRPLCPMWSHEYKKEPVTIEDGKAAEAMREFFAIKETEASQKKQLVELRRVLLTYMDQQKIDRVFGTDGYITRSVIERTSFDMETLEPILKRLGLWEKVLAPDAKRIEKILPSLPAPAQEELLSAREKKQTVLLKQTKAKK